MIDQGMQAGVFEEAEHDLVDNIFRLADQKIPQLMTPRPDIVWLDIESPIEEIRQRIINSPYSRMPVCQGTLDNILGVVKARDLLARILSGEPLDLRATSAPAALCARDQNRLAVAGIVQRLDDAYRRGR